jgi:hypothetical protein
VKGIRKERMNREETKGSDIREIEIKNYNKVRGFGFKESVHVASVCGEYTFIRISNEYSIQVVALQAVAILY